MDMRRRATGHRAALTTALLARIALALPTRIALALPTRIALALPTRIALALPTRIALALPTRIALALPTRIALALPAGIALALPASIALALPLASQALVKPKAPRASTGSALHVNESTVALSATVSPGGQQTTCYFQYGTTTAYEAQTPTAAVGSGTVAVRVSQPITGLQPGTTYHYRIVASNATGTSDGLDHTFTTKEIPLRFVITSTARVGSYGSPFALAGTLSGTSGANHQVILQASPFPYQSGFADIGAPQSTNAEGGFSLSVPSLSETTELRVRTLDPIPTYSPPVTVHAAVLVTLHVHPTKLKGYVRLYGTVTPAITGAPVVFQLIRPNLGPLGVSGTTTKRGTSHISRFSSVVFIPHGRGGSYRALVRMTNGRLASGYSRAVLLHSAPASVRRGRRGG
jgi:hypothetical protein